MKIDKIAFFLEHSFHIEFYISILNHLDKNEYCIVLDDFKKPKRHFNSLFLKTDNLISRSQYIYLSDLILKNTKFPILVTSLTTTYNFIKIFKFNLIFKKKSLFLKIFSKIFKTRTLFLEKMIADKVVFYPRGLDLKKNYPGEIRVNSIDYFFCHSELDQKIISKKVNKKSWIIGYPRYESIINKKPVNENRILWLQSISHENKKNVFKNTEDWLNRLKPLTNNFEICFKSHPSVVLPKNLKQEILDSKIKIIDNDKHELNYQYKLSNYVFTPDTGPFYSSIYLRKKILITELIKGNLDNDLQNIFNEFKKYFILLDKDFEKKFYSQNFWLEQKKISEILRSKLFSNYPSDQSLYTANLLKRLQK